MQEAKKSMKENGIKAEDVKNLPPIEEIHGLNLPPIKETYDLNPLFIEEPPDLDNSTQVVKVNSLYRYDKAEIPPAKFAGLPVFLFGLFKGRLIRIVFLFGTIWVFSSPMLVLLWRGLEQR